jgi:hypothetical protein
MSYYEDNSYYHYSEPVYYYDTPSEPVYYEDPPSEYIYYEDTPSESPHHVEDNSFFDEEAELSHY